MSIRKYGRYWAVYTVENALLCVCVYKKGAEAVVRRLQELDEAQRWVDRNGVDEVTETVEAACSLW